MTHAERFLQFVQQRNERGIRDLQVSIRIEENDFVVTQRWIDKSSKAHISSPKVEAKLQLRGISHL
jgi:hypothetical protein